MDRYVSLRGKVISSGPDHTVVELEDGSRVRADDSMLLAAIPPEPPVGSIVKHGKYYYLHNAPGIWLDFSDLPTIPGNMYYTFEWNTLHQGQLLYKATACNCKQTEGEER